MKTVCCLSISCILLLCGGCKRSPAMKEADSVRRAAIGAYATNTNLIEQTVIGAYGDTEKSKADLLYDFDLAKLEKAAGADGKLSAADAIAFVQRINAARAANYDKINTKIAQLNQAIEANKQNLISFLRLDDLAQQWQDAGIDPALVQNSLQQILDIVKQPIRAQIVPLKGN